MPQLVADSVGQRFGRRRLFRRLSFVLEAGHSLAVTGANGAGKSTLLKILAGVLRPTRGTVALSLDGRVLAAEQRPLYTGLVAPYLNVYASFTPRENLAFLARARRLPEAARRIDAVLDLVGLSDRADDRVETFSSGMTQRVKYAAALLAEPPLLLLDEPSANLDAAGRAMAERVAAYQQAQRRLLVLATNRAEEAARCDSTLVLEDFC